MLPLAGCLGGGGGDDGDTAASNSSTTGSVSNYAISSDAKVTIAGGEIQGLNLSTGVRAFLGVPYAAPPVGNLRWKPPQAVVPWSGTKATQTLPPGAIYSTATVTLNGTNTVLPTSEDCLYLNMWVPPEAKAKAGGLPVLVWMHGSNGNVSQPRYTSPELAKKGIIYINIARRQGVFANLALAELSAEAENKGSSGNFYMLDMIAGLKWVRDNIAKFGGDPDNVTLSGQSQGSIYTAKLQASPLSKGLYKRIFAESGAPIAGSTKTTIPSLAEMETVGAAWMAKFGTVSGTTAASRVADLRAKTTAEILAVSGSFSSGLDYILPDTVQNIFLDGKQNDVPMYIGYTRDEGGATIAGVTNLATYKSALLAKFGTDYDKVFSLYPAFNDTDALTQALRLNNETAFGLQMPSWARLQKMTGKSPVYLYRFDRANSSGLVKHGGDVPYWRGMLATAYGDNSLPYQTAGDYDLTNKMMDSLVAWCTNGNPSTADVKVPEFNPNDEKFVCFDVNTITSMPVSQGVDWFFDNVKKYSITTMW